MVEYLNETKLKTENLREYNPLSYQNVNQIRPEELLNGLVKRLLERKEPYPRRSLRGEI